MRSSRRLSRAPVLTLADQIRAESIGTDADELSTAREDETVERVLPRLLGFDQVPVIGGPRRRLVTTAAMLAVPGRTQMRELPGSDLSLSLDAPLEQVVHALKDRKAVLLDGGGLVHYSDLNRQPLRVFCYLFLSALEMGLAELVESAFGRENWWTHLPASRQELVRKLRAREAASGIEIELIEGAELTDLIKVAASSPAVGKMLGLKQSELRKKLNSLVQIRNRAMHPVRLLISKHEDVAKLDERLSTLRDLVKRSAKVIVRPL